MPSSDEAFVTLATNDSYAVGALVLGASLRVVGTTRQLAILITSSVSEPLRHEIESVFDSVTYVDVLDSNDTENLRLLTRPDLGVTFTKLHCWRLTQYTKCVFLDADTLVIQNIDNLFEREELSAAPDVGWPDCFNSGVFVYRPSIDTYRSLLSFALTHGSFDGGDQGLLNAYFSDWATRDISRRLPYVYNVVAQTFYSYGPALKQFGKDVKVIHFIGATKPWHLTYNVSTRNVVVPHGDPAIQHSQEFLRLWWSIFIDRVKSKLHVDTVQLTDDVCRLTIYSPQQLAAEHRQYSWERGQVDYLGIDAFENIQKQLDATLQKKPTSSPTAAQEAVPPPRGVVPPPRGVVPPQSVIISQGVVPPQVPSLSPASPPTSPQSVVVKSVVSPPKNPVSQAAGQTAQRVVGPKTSSITIVTGAKRPPPK